MMNEIPVSILRCTALSLSDKAVKGVTLDWLVSLDSRSTTTTVTVQDLDSDEEIEANIRLGF